VAVACSGHCWFAGEDVAAGEWIWEKRPDGAPHMDISLAYEQINALPPEKKQHCRSPTRWTPT